MHPQKEAKNDHAHVSPGSESTITWIRQTSRASIPSMRCCIASCACGAALFDLFRAPHLRCFAFRPFSDAPQAASPLAAGLFSPCAGIESWKAVESCRVALFWLVVSCVVGGFFFFQGLDSMGPMEEIG